MRAWTFDPWPYLFVGGSQPYAGKRMSSGIPGQSADTPSPNLDEDTNLAVAVRAWQPPPPLPTLSGKLPPQITAVQVDNPIPNADASVNAGVIESFKLYDPWTYDYLGDQSGAQPYGARQLNPQITAVPVNDPPYGYGGPNAESVILAVRQWIKDPLDPLPTLSGKLSPGIPGQSVDNPTPTYDLGEFIDIVRAWQPPDPLPTLSGKLSPGIPGQSVDWQPYVSKDIFGDPVRLPWYPDPPLPTLPKMLSPGIPGQSVNQPPPFKAFTPTPAPDAPYPQQLFPRVVQETAAVVTYVPYTTPWLITVLAAWQDQSRLPELPLDIVQPAATATADNPPFSNVGRSAIAAEIVAQWHAPTPAPLFASPTVKARAKAPRVSNIWHARLGAVGEFALGQQVPYPVHTAATIPPAGGGKRKYPLYLDGDEPKKKKTVRPIWDRPTAGEPDQEKAPQSLRSTVEPARPALPTRPDAGDSLRDQIAPVAPSTPAAQGDSPRVRRFVEARSTDEPDRLDAALAVELAVTARTTDTADKAALPTFETPDYTITPAIEARNVELTPEANDGLRARGDIQVGLSARTTETDQIAAFAVNIGSGPFAYLEITDSDQLAAFALNLGSDEDEAILALLLEDA